MVQKLNKYLKEMLGDSEASFMEGQLDAILTTINKNR